MTIEAIVYLVEDDDVVWDLLQMVLESVGYKVVVYFWGDAFLEDFSIEMVGCLVLDICMFGMNGMELQRQLNSCNSILSIIFVIGYGDVFMVVEVMQKGVVDFVQKPYWEEELLGKIQQAIVADVESCAELAEKHKIVERLQELIFWEKQVMDLMIEGKVNKVIVFDLDISQRIVEIHCV